MTRAVLCRTVFNEVKTKTRENVSFIKSFIYKIQNDMLVSLSLKLKSIFERSIDACFYMLKVICKDFLLPVELSIC